MRFIERLKEKREIEKLERFLKESGLQNGLKNKVLNLQHNWLGKLPNYLKDLERIIKNTKDLERLGLRDNELANLPEYITTLKELKILYLGFNEIYTIPNSIGQLTKLEELDLENNGLSMIPESIGELKELKKLELKNNRLTRIPKSLCELIKQKKDLAVYLQGNKFDLLTIERQEYTILNQEYIYTNCITNKIDNKLVKHLSELTQDDLEKMVVMQIYVQKETINNYTTAGVTLTPATTINIVSKITGKDYTKENLIDYKEGKTIIKAYDNSPEENELIEKIIKLCPQITKLLEQETMIKKGNYELIL